MDLLYDGAGLAANPQMTMTGEHIFLAVAAAAATIALIMWSAPSFQAGIYRLNLIFNTLGIAIVLAGWAVGIGMFIWGIAKGSKDIIYMSFLPMVFAGAMYNLITRRHTTWWEIFGFRDGHGRWRSFWDETRNLWGLPPRSKPASGAAAPTPPGGQSGPGGAPAGPPRSFSFSFGTPARRGSGGVLGPIISFAASRLATGHITVFPNVLQFAIELDPAGNGQQPHLDAFRQSLMVRRRDGGYLQLAVASDLAFLDVTAGPRNFDGSYTVTVGLIAARLPQGPFRGSIIIDTGDPVEPQLTVPVVGTVA